MPISKKRLQGLTSIKNSQIDFSDIPQLDQDFWENAKLVMPDKKVPVSLRLDKNIIDWFKKQGKGYQSRINAILSSYVQTQR